MLPVKQKAFKDMYIYGANFLAVAPTAVATFVINISADSDFELQKLTYSADLAGAAQTDSSRTVPKCSLIVLDNGSGRQMMDRAIPIPSFFGNGEKPYILPTPRLWRRNTSISLTLTNYDAAETYNVYLGFIGVKIFTDASFVNGL